MISHCLLILSLFFPLPSLCVQNSSWNDSISLAKTVGITDDWQVGFNSKRNDTSLQRTESADTTNLRSWNGQIPSHHRRHLRNTHGVLNIIGWGTLLPAGAIVARSFRKFPLECEEWYNFHVLCQTLGYIVGTIGWSIGTWLGNSSKQHRLRTHRILGIIIFTLSTLQMFALCLQPKKENECSRWWKIYHKLLGYLLISMIIANIFQGIDHKGHAEKWKWVYVGILSVLALTALVLEIFRFVIARIHQRMAFDINPNVST